MRANAGFRKKVVETRFVLVVARQDAALVFKRVTERNVRDVVKQCRNADELFVVGETS